MFFNDHGVCLQINFVINVVTGVHALEVPIIPEISNVHVENAALIETPGFIQVFFVSSDMLF